MVPASVYAATHTSTRALERTIEGCKRAVITNYALITVPLGAFFRSVKVITLHNRVLQQDLMSGYAGQSLLKVPHCSVLEQMSPQ